jgi:hypothetical protein
MSGADVLIAWLMKAGVTLLKLTPFLVVGWYVFKHSELGRALLHSRDTSRDILLLQQDMDALRGELSELQERPDFSERALAQLDRPLPAHEDLPKYPTPPEPVHG